MSGTTGKTLNRKKMHITSHELCTIHKKLRGRYTDPEPQATRTLNPSLTDHTHMQFDAMGKLDGSMVIGWRERTTDKGGLMCESKKPN
jgi:hypothetical protein